MFFVLPPMSADAASIMKEDGDIIYRSSNNNSTVKKISNASVGEISNTNSNISPDVFSSKADTIPFLWFNLVDKDYQNITGIVVDKIELYQQGNLILSTTNVTSYSHAGNYELRNATLKSHFSNSNGDNKIDIVFYKNGAEVARLADFTIQCYDNAIVSSLYSNRLGIERSEFPLKATILNVNDKATVDAYVTDSNGDKVATLVAENKESRNYNSGTKALYVGLKMTKGPLFKNSHSGDYKVHIVVNNIEMPFSKDYQNKMYVYDKPAVNTIYGMAKSPYHYHIEGINLINANPFTLELKQKGEIIGEITGINAKFDPKTYSVYIDEDITSKIKDPKTEMQTTLYSEGAEPWTFTYFEQPDAPETNTTNTLKSIAITAPATKLSYSIGDELDITGLEVTGTYSDGSSKVESITAANVTGFTSSVAAKNQVLTITVGTKTTTFKVQIVAAPLPPVTGVSLKTISSSEIDLSWDKINEAKSYNIYRATSENGKYAKVGSSKTTSFKNTKLKPSVSYWYKVTAVATGGESGFSDIKTATTLALAPSGVKAKVVSSTAVTLTWKAMPGSTFNVYRSTSQKVGYTKIAEELNAQVYADNNLMPKTAYWYYLIALDSNGRESAASTPVKALTKVSKG